ncbi:MAG: PHP domain-containing protein [Candidatus Hodarchaeales archaeon]|jgi:predicted metal-dependent phosphoesterase TrpH
MHSFNNIKEFISFVKNKSLNGKKVQLYDLHCHSTYSDGSSSLEELAKRAQEIGLDGFGLTDHNTVVGHKKIERLSDEYGILIIPGEEITTLKGRRSTHVLSYFQEVQKNYIPPYQGIKKTIDLIHDNDGKAVIAHPFDMMIGCKNFKDYEFDAFEIYNGQMIQEMLSCEKILKYKNNTPLTAGSDSHQRETLGKVGVISPYVKNIGELLNNILDRKVHPYRYYNLKEFVADLRTMDKKNLMRKKGWERWISKNFLINPDIKHVITMHKAGIILINAIDRIRLRKY